MVDTGTVLAPAKKPNILVIRGDEIGDSIKVDGRFLVIPRGTDA
jgi:hypothetical protein